MRPRRRTMLAVAVIGAILHTVTVLRVWKTWSYFGRASFLTWADFPVSLSFLHLTGDRMLAASLVAGGLQWAVIAALLTLWVGRTARRNSTPPGSG